ncbi:MAG: ABC transporter substrate-binding protein [Patescibacteria group bacterium]|nr:ABC transporter substrate-binding protein [Patescibacteria group bacterium]
MELPTKNQWTPLESIKKYSGGLKKFKTLTGWRQFFKVLTKREKILFLIFLFLALSSLCFLSYDFYLKNTEIKPAFGGVFTEGVIGQPRFINPIYAQVSDIDRDLVELIFSGLMKYNLKGEIVPDLAKSYEIKEGGKVYEIYLKENLFWSDGFPLTADDVIFTIETIQNSDYKSPIRANFLGVEVERISDLGVAFKLKNPYSAFLENLTLKIIPKHIWEKIPPQNFPLAAYNLNPVGSGIYKLKSLKQTPEGRIISLDLIKNQKYFGKSPYLSQISFQFFESQEELIKAAQEAKIKGLTLTPIGNLEEKDLATLEENFNLYSLSLPRYFTLFFNPENSKVLSEKEVRKALNYGTNKKEIVEKVLKGRGQLVQSPILPEIYGFNPPSEIYQFDPEKAKEILEKAGFIENELGLREKIIKKEPAFQFKSDLEFGSQGDKVRELQRCLAKDTEIYPEGEITGFFGEKTKRAVIRFQEKYKKDILDPWGFEKGTGIVRETTRKKLNEICFEPIKEVLPLKFSLVTVDQPILIEVANLLKNQWKTLGAEIEIKTFNISDLENIIKKRDYQSLLFGEVLGAIPDPFPFWHSIQKKDPGLNLALYENKKVDSLLKEARETLNEAERKKKLEEFQDILIEDAPCIFLYQPDYLYFVSKEIKGIDIKTVFYPSKRFSEIENWYVKTKRGWK